MEYCFKLQQFEGPLHLLLHLIDKAKIDIRDIFISQITEQYLEYIKNLDSLDMETASEFLAMAATLLQIKSKSLLPRHEEDTDPDEEQIIRQLEEYRLFKLVSGQMKEMEGDAGQAYYKLPEEFIGEPAPIHIEGATAQSLFFALQNALSRQMGQETAPQIAVREILKDKYTIRERMQYVKNALQGKRRMKFREFFRPASTRMEIVCTFVAVLELLAANEIEINQDGIFQDIIIKLIKD